MGDPVTVSDSASNITPSGQAGVTFCKVHEVTTFSTLLGELKVAACMISDSIPIVDEASVVREAETITERKSEGGCSSCNAGPFESRAQQIAHYKHHWHAYNLRRRLLGRPPMSFIDFNAREDDQSSVSDSDSDSETNVLSKGEKQVSDLFIAATRHCRAYFTNDKGQVLSVYRCLLHHKKEWLSGDGKGDKWVIACKDLCKSGGWAVIMCAGGHFSGGIFKGESGVAHKHKTLRSYVTRRSQGKAQGTRDSRGNAPRSAGASLRRYNQEQFAQHVQEILTSWKEDLEECSLILYRAVGPLNKACLFGVGSPLYKKDTRLRTLPFPTRRPSYKEIQRAHSILATVEIFESYDIFQKTFCSVNNTSNNSVPERPTRKVQKGSPQKINRAKSREAILRPTPGVTISSEDEIPCYQQSIAPPDWTKKLAKYDKSLKGGAKKPAAVQTDSENDELITETLVINTKDTLQEFDNSLKKKNMKKVRKPKAVSGTNRENLSKDTSESSNKKENILNNNSKTKTRNSSGKTIIKVPSIVKKLWETYVDEVNFKKLLDTWDNALTIEESLNFQDPADGNTVLHKAAISELPSIVTQLLEFGADPCSKNLQLQTPYCATCHQETRIAFRLFQGLHPDKYQYSKANIPGPLTYEMIEQEREKKALLRKMKRQKDKEKQQEKAKSAQFLELNDKQKMAAQEERCFACGGKIASAPFAYNNYKFCDIKCLQHHRNARPLILSTQ